MTMRQPMPLSPIYSEYAAAYDRTGQIRFSILMELYLREIVDRHPVPGKRLLDIACGTGTLALMMADAGWEVTGLDASWAMLQEAHRKQQSAGVDAAFVQGDIRDFAALKPADLVTCCYDSLNYLLAEDELLRCFQSVHNVLSPGGLFCFDLATEYFLRNYWQDVETYREEGYEQVMESSFEERTGRSTLVLTGREWNGTGRPRQFREVHVERAYVPEVVDRLLSEAGLTPEALYDCFTHQPPNAASLRHFWVARKDV